MKDLVSSIVSPTEADEYVPGHGDLSYDVASYALELDYAVDGNRLDGRATITAEAADDLSVIDLDLRGLRASKVSVKRFGVDRFSHVRGKLHVKLGKQIPAGTTFEVVVVYGGKPAPVRSRWGTVGWEELADGAIVAAQPSGAPSWFPCNDRPSDKASYTFEVTVASGYTVVANGTPTGTRRRASSTTWSFEQPEPMATYLATVQIGRYSTHTSYAAGVEQRHVLPAALRASYDEDFGRQPAMLETFTEHFGPYPFGSYTVVVTADDLEIPLEAQGLSIFGANHLDGHRGLERLVAHELAHQWFGNSLTLSTWDQIWLHEGFACYAEWLWSEASGGASAHDHALEHWGRLAELDQDVTVGDPGPELMFDDRVYKRGALTLHAVRRTVGDDAFFTMLRAWVAGRRHGTVTTEAFVRHAEASTGQPLRGLLERWLDAEPLPRLP
ncbi:M1 family metallopeptidase [Solicola sp. PLA-1-18]|uniref:M1 family metallopeptidase n=1 Tax=Solicola sp. PLA-1-18 TaxID=3380532 RepID=UPI003B7B7699